MRSQTKLFVAAISVGLAACTTASGGDGVPGTPLPAPAGAIVADTPQQVGEPYSLAGQRYTPIDQTDYDEVGYASWYGAELAGRPTANGEIFNPAWVSAAHRTLPMPSYVEVTRLDTGQTILVRINDRGPADSRRLIDLSAGAAGQLGITDMGQVAVRVRRTNPVEAERLALRSGRAVPERLPTPDSLLAILRERAARLPVPTSRGLTANRPLATAPGSPPDQTSPGTVAQAAAAATNAGRSVTTATPSGYVVQLAAFSDRRRADALAQRLGATVVTAGTVHRVRYGPFATEAEARSALQRARQRGHSAGVIVRDR
jgi:rare lipoprotein A